jgi:putative nucleotidyltransferase with HDIG domain
MRQTATEYTLEEDGSVVEGPPPPGEEEISTQSALLVPLKVAGKTIGVLQLQSSQRNAYTEEARSLLLGLANVAAVAIQNARLYGKVEKALETTIQTLGLTTETRDPYTAGHQRRVAELACAIAEELHVEEQSVRGIRAAGLIHDIGKLSIPAEILSKPSTLTPLELGLVKAHAQTGYDILKGIVFPWPVAEMVLQHHERLDGSGYPQGLTGDAIVLGARILAVADVVEAMASHRPYRAALGIDKALEEIARGAGTVYDDQVASACLRLFAEKRFSFDGQG